MDTYESGWILEFLIPQKSLDDQTLINLIRDLPLPNNNPKLQKSLNLRKLESDIESSSISERTLDILEEIEELDHKERASEVSEASEAMKAAYATVAMHCTAKLLEDVPGDRKTKYACAVRQLWSARVCNMERCDVRLVPDDLIRWVHDVEAGVLDVDVCENVVKRFTELDVVQSVRRYVNEAKEEMGRSFLEVACEAVLSDDALREAMGLDQVSELGGGSDEVQSVSKEALRTHEDEVSKLNNQSKDNVPADDAGANSKGNEASKAHVPPTHNHVDRGPKIVEPHAAMKDPLPDAVRLAESLKLKVSMSGENGAHDLVGGNSTGVNDKDSSHDRKSKSIEVDGDDDIVKDQNRRILPSSFGRNHTAHTTEWSNSVDTSKDRSPTRPHLPSPQKRKVSPLSAYEIEKLLKQRKKRKWTVSEEDTLRAGVQKLRCNGWVDLWHLFLSNIGSVV